MNEQEEKYITRLASCISHAFHIPATQEEIDFAVRLGMIPIIDLVDGQWYMGYCRNANKARWDATRQEWFYNRYKFGWCTDYTDPVNTTCTSDMFIPLVETTEDTSPTDDNS